jgi:hypothetical protein
MNRGKEGGTPRRCKHEAFGKGEWRASKGETAQRYKAV